MRFNILDQWLNYLETIKVDRTPKKALKDIKIVAKRLKVFPCNKKIITITGTNGKGSCTALLKSIYTEAGYKVGTLTSPHLVRYNERICINKKFASNKDICSAFNQIDKARGNIQLTYVQFAFLAALILFKKANVELLLLEVGVGGLYDMANIFDANLAIISNIDLDHCQLLGDTRDLIAIKKAGIMRKGRPAICGDLNPPKTLLKEAKRMGSILYIQNKDFSFKENKTTWDWKSKNSSLKKLPKPCIKLLNASTVLMAVNLFNNILPISKMNILKGLKNLYIPARCELIKYKGKKVLLDVAHNPAAMKNLSQHIDLIKNIDKKYVVFGMLINKDIVGSLHAFSNNKIDKWFLTTLIEGERSTNAKYLGDILKGMCIKNFLCYDKPILAFEAAFKQASSKDLIIVCGSFRTVGNIVENINFRGKKWTKN